MKLPVRLSEAWNGFNGHHVARSAAALTFYLILAFSPMLLFLAALSSLMIGSPEHSLQNHILDIVQSSIGIRQAAIFKEFVEGSSSRTGGYVATILGLTVSLYGASGLFLQLRATVDQIFGASPRPGIRGFFLSRAGAILGVLLIGVVLVGWIGVDSWLHIVRRNLEPEAGRGTFQAISFLLAFAFWTPVYACIYRWVSPRPVEWRHTWLSALITSLSYSAVKYGLSLYFTFSSSGPSYGPAGAIVILLVCAYYLAQIFLFGFELARAGEQRDEIRA